MKIPKWFDLTPDPDAIARIAAKVAEATATVAKTAEDVAAAALAFEESGGAEDARKAYDKAEAAQEAATRRVRQLSQALVAARARVERYEERAKADAAKAAEAMKSRSMAELRAAAAAFDALLPDLAAGAQRLVDAIRATTVAVGDKEASRLALNKLSIMIPYVVDAAISAVPSAKRAPLSDEALASLSQYLLSSTKPAKSSEAAA